MAATDNSPVSTSGGKVSGKTALIIIALVAAGGYLLIRSRGGASPAGQAAPAGSGTVTTSYGLGPEWVLTAVRDLHSHPRRKPHRGVTDKKP